MVNKIKNAVIAAAGFGSRLGKDLPKCMIKVGDKLVLDYIVQALYPNIKNIILVAGYKHEIIEKYCNEKYPFIKVILNEKYSETNTAYSFSLGSSHLKGKCLFLDGDLILCPNSTSSFIRAAEEFDMLLGITKNITENPVYTKIKEQKIVRFSRRVKTEFEWANIFCADSRILDKAENFVYEELEKSMPLNCFNILLQEIDTEGDFLKAIKFIKVENL